MKKRLISFLLLCLPTICWAGDHCTNPDRYTLDKRCYVTDAQKKTKPFSSVVALGYCNNLDNLVDGPYCSGTLVEGKNNNIYLVTAKHCVINENDIPYKYQCIRTQRGHKYKTHFVDAGGYHEDNDFTYGGDWAVYYVGKKADIDDIDFVRLFQEPRSPASEDQRPVNPWTNYDRTYDYMRDIYDGKYDAFSVGYGALKIMSDKEIQDFRTAYFKWLKKNNLNDLDDGEAGIWDPWQYKPRIRTAASSINIRNEYVIKFLSTHPRLLDTDDTSKLKLSKCEYNFTSNKEIGCQAWGGNSGGGIFNRYGAVIGIHTRGNRLIGGIDHAEAGDNVTLLDEKLKEIILK